MANKPFKFLFLVTILLFSMAQAYAQERILSGKVVSERDKQPIEFASIQVKDHELWAFTDTKGTFVIKNVPQGRITLLVHCLGYVQKIITVESDKNALLICLPEDNLMLDEVEVTAKRSTEDATTSYLIDRMTLDNQQIMNVGEIATLLPGGKTVNSTLMNDERMALRSNSQEKGNASFGTAIEIDGVRLENNSVMGETIGASTRNISSSNIESVEVVAGIPSVEYGDLSNGILKVKTRKGKSPFIIEGKINQHTYQMAVHKGFQLGNNGGLLNASFERARSFSDIASPHTAYNRNILSLNYMKVFMPTTTPLTLNASASGNIGGYNSENDPDNTLNAYTKARDNLFRSSLSLDWLLNKSWITNVALKTSFSFQDKRTEDYSPTMSASTQPYIHTMEEGYFVATDYDTDPTANIILGPTGTWYVRGFNDQKPVNWSMKLNLGWNREMGRIVNKILLGSEFKASGNNGRGTYYEDMRYAPTWRPYRYNELPWSRNLALYAEDKVTIPTAQAESTRAPHAALQLTAGLRDDITMISGSSYGTVSSLTPRFNAKYTFWEKRKAWVSALSIHAGWGRSVKLPSFQTLYPSPSYSDILAFTPGSTADNKAYYAYYTYPSKAIYNPDLKWQYTDQIDMGMEMNVKGIKINLSGFYHKTFRPYMSIYQYTPYLVRRTNQGAIEGSGVATENRWYTIDQHTGIVTLNDLSGTVGPQELAYSTLRAYNSNRKYVNGSPVERYGLEWIVDFPQIKALRTSLRIDGNFYHYKSIDKTMFAGSTSGSGTMENTSYPLIGYYYGSSATSAGTISSGTIANGSESQQVNLNATLTTHIPKVRLIITLRLESSLYNYKRALSEREGGTRGIAVANSGDYFGEAYTSNMRDQFVVLYPDYYSTWSNPNELIPFAEKFAWARDNDRELYNQLSQLVVRNYYAYTLNPNYLSKYFSTNFTVTKEIGDHVSISFYANNFFNNMAHVRSSQTGLKTSLFGSSYIPKFYYGLSLRLKL